MKKQLLFEIIRSLFWKNVSKKSLTIFLLFLTVQSAFAQQWSILGNEGQLSTATSSHVSIAVVDETPYVIYAEGTSSGIGKVKKLNGSLWEQLGGNLDTYVSFTRIYSDKTGKLYVTYINNGNGNKLAVKTFNGTNWEPLISGNEYVSNLAVTLSSSGTNPAGATNIRSALAFDSNNVPYITYSANGIPYVMKFDGTAWVGVGSSSSVSGRISADITAVGNSIALDSNDIPYVVYINAATTSTGAIKTFRFNGNGWDNVSPPSIVGTVATNVSRHVNIVIDNEDRAVVSYYNRQAVTANCNSPIIRGTIDAISVPAIASWELLKITSTGSSDFKSNNLIKDVAGNLYNTFMYRMSTTGSRIQVYKQDVGNNTFYELVNAPATTGVETYTGNTSTITNPPEIAVGSNTVKPYVVYLRTSALTATPTTPVVRIFDPQQASIVLNTKVVTNITSNTVETGGEIISDGGSAITERGIVYSTTKNPTVINTKIVAATAGIGAYSVTIPNLNPATLYFARAYAINGVGTSNINYGDNVRLFTNALTDAVVTTPKQMEFLNRGVVALRKSSTQVFISWRFLGNDLTGTAFNIYRDSIKLNTTPISNSTNFLDNTAENGTYTVRAIINGVEGQSSESVSVWANNQLSIPLQIPPGGTLPDGKAYTYSANDASVGDVDGDGEYEIVLKWDPSELNDNAGGYSGEQIFDCYKLDGTKLWRINLGKNMNSGPHFNPFMVYDFDGDGKAEIILKTADGTVDGTGVVIGNANVDYRNSSGWVQQGPEFLTVFNGLTGAAMATVPYEPNRAQTSDWGDTYGNRQDRFVSAVAYLDGARPSIIVGRGYYSKLVRAAYDWRDGQLTLRWIFDSKDTKEPANNAFSSQGNHQMTIGDVDGDGKDEVINGASVINDDGKRLWTYGYGHGDALHMSDMDPDRPGQEIWMCHEDPGSYDSLGIRLTDAKNGATIFGAKTTGDVGRALAADVDPNHRGYEMWSSSGNFYNVQDGQIGTSKPTGGSQAVNHLVWWDGDLGRELMDGTIIDKWNPTTKSLNRVFTIYNAAPVNHNNSSKKNPALSADILGDWREEILLRRSDNTALILFTTNTPTEHRIYTLMHDPQYRTAIAWQNSGYNQPPHPSFFLGYDMAEAPMPNIEIKYIEAPKIENKTVSTRIDGCDTNVNYAAEALGYPVPAYAYTFSGATTAAGAGTGSGSIFNKGLTTVNIEATNISGTVNYNFDVIVNDSIAPTLVAPASLNLCYNDTYIIPKLEINDNCEIASVTYSITGVTERNSIGDDASGSFNVGESIINWTVIDANGNQTTASTVVVINAQLSVRITDAYAINQSASLVNTIYRGYGSSSLPLNAMVNGGSAAYSYLWNTGATSSSIHVNNAGTYTVTIRDSKGCTAQASIEVNLVDVKCGNNNNKVEICHNGVTLCVASAAVQTHLNHGCKLGSCTTTTKSPQLLDILDPLLSFVSKTLAYPNPTEGKFTVDLSDYKSSKAEFIITNIFAQVIMRKEVSFSEGKQTVECNLSNYPPGIYIVKVLSSDGEKTIKMIRN